MPTTRRMLTVALAVFGLVRCSDSTGPGDVDFTWSGAIATGDVIEIKGITGSVHATRTGGDTVTVTATKVGHGDDPNSVDIEVVIHAGGVTICAVYPDVAGQPPNECAPGAQGHMSAQGSDVEVTFTVSVPTGVDFVGTTVNGSVTATALRSDVAAATVNGDVTVSTTTLATGATVNGNVTAAIGLADWGRDLDFTTVNGNVAVEVPSATNAEVRLTTVSGVITSDFSLAEVAPGDVRGTIGAGGPLLRLTAVNGNIALQRGS